MDRLLDTLLLQLYSVWSDRFVHDYPDATNVRHFREWLAMVGLPWPPNARGRALLTEYYRQEAERVAAGKVAP